MRYSLRFAPTIIPLFVLLTGLLSGPGCTAPTRPVPFTPPNSRPLAPADALSGGVVQSAAGLPLPQHSDDAYPMRRPRNILALSGGGAYGAYTAGFLSGWTKGGNRPEFDVVTGISTGALIAPLAFLGSDYDDRLAHLYTQVQASDVFKVRAWVTIPYKDAAASSNPLKHLIEAEITPEMMNRIAAEHRKGRRLYVGTTNLDTRRLVVWDLGAIACRPAPEGCILFRDVLMASCAVPGMFPPVRFNLEVDGSPATELHADGGVAAQLFVPSHVFAAAAPNEANAEPGNLYLLVAGKLYPDAAPVKPRVLPVLAASANSVIYAHCRAELANLYGLARSAGLNYRLTSLRQDFPPLDMSLEIDQQAMSRLYEEGAWLGASGPTWMSGPPTLSPGDGDYIRTGLKLRTVPQRSGN